MLQVGASATLSFTFSEKVFGFTAADLTTPNAKAKATDPISSDGGLNWTATLTPELGFEDSTNTVTLIRTQNICKLRPRRRVAPWVVH